MFNNFDNEHWSSDEDFDYCQFLNDEDLVFEPDYNSHKPDHPDFEARCDMEEKAAEEGVDLGHLNNPEVVREDVAEVERYQLLTLQNDTQRLQREINLLEAVKFKTELEQALRNGPLDNSPRRLSLQWRYDHILAFIMSMTMLPGALAEGLSPQEQWANAVSTLIWTCMCALVLYMFGTTMRKFFDKLGTVFDALAAAILLVSQSFSATLNAINLKLGVLVDAYIEYLKWMKIISLVTAVAQGVNSLINLIHLPFSLFTSARKSSPFCRMSAEGKPGPSFAPQDANKYGFLLSTILATCMFIFVPLWGFSKSFKCFEAPMRILEKVPYVTWLIDFMSKWSAGEATTADIPEDIHDFARGKEATKLNKGLYDFGYGTSHVHMAHDIESCGNDVRLLGRCGDGECYCKCHVGEEAEEASATMNAAAEGIEDLETKAGLGSDVQLHVRRTQRTFVKSMEEPIESRRERISAEEPLCQRCGRNAFGRKICPDCVADEHAQGSSLKEKEKEKVDPEVRIIDISPGPSKARLHLTNDGKKIYLEKDKVYAHCVYNHEHPGGCSGECLKKTVVVKATDQEVIEKVDQILKNQSLGLAFDTWWLRERTLWSVTQQLGLEFWDYFRIRSNQLREHIMKNKMVYAAAACTVVAAIVTIGKMIPCKELSPEFMLEGSSSRRSRVVMAPKQYVAARNNRRRKTHLVSGGDEHDLDEQDYAAEKYERETEEYSRAQELEDRYAEDKKRKREQHECIHFANCPTMPMQIDSKRECHTACGGHTCCHFATCVPKNEKSESLPVKVKELKMKHFPIKRSPVVVARAARIVRKAKTTDKYFTREELKEHLAAKEITKVNMTEESLLGKTRTIHKDVAAHVFKVLYDGIMTSSATVVADKVVVPLHSHLEGQSVSISNATASAQLKGEIIPIADDLGVFYHRGAVSCGRGWRMEVPTTGIAMQLGFKSPDEVEPTHGVGFYSSTGLYDAPTEAGNCAGPVVSCTTGALIGFHIAGSDNVNRFVPLTDEIIRKLKMSEPVLTSTLFQ